MIRQQQTWRSVSESGEPAQRCFHPQPKRYVSCVQGPGMVLGWLSMLREARALRECRHNSSEGLVKLRQCWHCSEWGCDCIPITQIKWNCGWWTHKAFLRYSRASNGWTWSQDAAMWLVRWASLCAVICSGPGQQWHLHIPVFVGET